MNRPTNMLPNIFIVVLAFAILCVAGYGMHKMSKDYDGCTDSAYIDLSDVNVDSYDVAPYHGGRVYTEYNISGLYECEYSGKQFWIRLYYTSRADISGKLPKGITVRFNPDNPDYYVVEAYDFEEMTGVEWHIATSSLRSSVEYRPNIKQSSK